MDFLPILRWQKNCHTPGQLQNHTSTSKSSFLPETTTVTHTTSDVLKAENG